MEKYNCASSDCFVGSSRKFEIRIERKELESGFGWYCEPVLESGAERKGAASDAIDGAKR